MTENPSREALRREIATAWASQSGSTLYRRLLKQHPEQEEVIEELFAEQMRESLHLDEAEAALRRAEVVFEEYLSDPLRHPAAIAARKEVADAELSFPEWLDVTLEEMGSSIAAVAQATRIPRPFLDALARISDLPSGVAAHIARRVAESCGMMQQAVLGALSAQVQAAAAYKYRGEGQPGAELSYQEAVERYIPEDQRASWLELANGSSDMGKGK